MHRATPDGGAMSLSYDTVLLESDVMIDEEADPLFLERELNVHTATRATEDMAGTLVESDSDSRKHQAIAAVDVRC